MVEAPAETQLDSVLVTGASGFIGSCLVRRLCGLGAKVTCLARPTSRVEHLTAVGAKVVTGDITDRDSIARALTESQPTVVFHLAGLVRALSELDYTFANFVGVERVRDACEAHPQPPLLVLVSSLAAAGPCVGEQPRVERDYPTPVSHYGHSKLLGELAVSAHVSKFPVSIVRPPIVFGPGDRAVLEMFKPIYKSGIHATPGPGTARFSLIHVEDLVEGLILVARRGERVTPDGPAGRGIYYLSSESSPTYIELGHTIARAVGRERASVIRIPGAVMRFVAWCADGVARARSRPGWISRDKITEALAGSWVCSSAKAREQLGWSPAARLETRLRETAEWYKGEGWL